MHKIESPRRDMRPTALTGLDDVIHCQGNNFTMRYHCLTMSKNVANQYSVPIIAFSDVFHQKNTSVSSLHLVLLQIKADSLQKEFAHLQYVLAACSLFTCTRCSIGAYAFQEAKLESSAVVTVTQLCNKNQISSECKTKNSLSSDD
jgi:hypothetical protein